MTTRTAPLPAIVMVPILVAVGGLVSVQARVNALLAAELGTGARAGVGAAFISFGTGLVLLTIIMTPKRQRQQIGTLYSTVRIGKLNPAFLLGGLGGAFLVATQGLTGMTLGIALLTVAIVAGQTSAALVVDKAGLGPVGRQAVTVRRIIAAVCTIAAVGLTVMDRVGGGQQLTAATLVLLLLPVLAGASVAVQQAINGRVAQVSNTWVATWNNFVFGTIGLGIVLGITMFMPGEFHGLPSQWWLYLSAPMGITFIATLAFVARFYNILLVSLCTIAGQIMSAAVIDVIDPEMTLGWLTAAGVLLTFTGVSLAILSRRVGRKPAVSAAK